ncbi:signal peptide protein [Alcanivorax sp. S71-1-4]|uniref:DUF2846 domain-containing protein n=1 Tax=Alcanivorax sp. S71-1-4 TaxID=1177159 RepID=UPI001357C96C|nr:DUF2846 domain-containing protein [Alcanivorax sp. S71-1-4]KAF0806258.1 signal peptide protein [Alcanivorax sp. S71-1-4]
MRVTLIVLLAWCVTGCGTVAMPRTPGAFIEAAGGETFEPLDTLDPRNAMVYLYRPGNQWGYEEVQAPTFFINEQQLAGLKSGAYTWLELHGGEYDLYARRPLSILFLKTIFELPLKVEGGQTYYLRYSEDQPLDYAARGLDPAQFMQAGPLQQVPEPLALAEIRNLRLDEAGYYYGGDAYSEPRWAPFFSYDAPERMALLPAAKSRWQRMQDWVAGWF